jgi:hypothetical protein
MAAWAAAGRHTCYFTGTRFSVLARYRALIPRSTTLMAFRLIDDTVKALIYFAEEAAAGAVAALLAVAAPSSRRLANRFLE